MPELSGGKSDSEANENGNSPGEFMIDRILLRHAEHSHEFDLKSTV